MLFIGACGGGVRAPQGPSLPWSGGWLPLAWGRGLGAPQGPPLPFVGARVRCWVEGPAGALVAAQGGLVRTVGWAPVAVGVGWLPLAWGRGLVARVRCWVEGPAGALVAAQGGLVRTVGWAPVAVGWGPRTQRKGG